MKRVALGLVAALAVPVSGWAAEITQALQHASGSPELRALAQAWSSRGDELLRGLASSTQEERRGAAVLIGELRADCGIPPERLLAALSACKDDEARRWAGRALLGRLADIPPAKVLDLQDPPLVLRLLADHPAAATLTDAAVVARLRLWLADAAWCEQAALLIAQRGTTATWGKLLVEAIATAAKQKADGAPVIYAAHQALCQLTRTQRGLASYAGHYDLLVADWNDALSATTPATTATDPAVVDAIGRLPAAEALTELLRTGPSALPALEQAMAAADKERRRELASAARLVARAVSPGLHAKLGDAGLVGIDAARPKERLAALTAIAAVVQSEADAAGILHLVTWLDDPDATVRVAALDRLVRLSDAHKTFKQKWSMQEDGLFPPAQCRWRLRRSLTRGGSDEQVSALQVIASLKANDLADDVAGLLLSPAPIVVETAIETLGHLSGSGQQAPLMRLVSDRRQPTPRRITVLEMLSKNAGSGNSGNASEQAAQLRLADQLERVGIDGDDPLMRGPARKAQFALVVSAEKRTVILDELLSGPPEAQRAGLELIHHTASDPWRYRLGSGNQTEFYLDRALPFLFDDRTDVATLAAGALVQPLDDNELRDRVLGLFPATSAARQSLTQWCARTDRPWPDHLALGVALNVVTQDAALAALRSIPEGGMRNVWYELVRRSDDPAAILRNVLGLQPADGVVPNAVAYQVLKAVTAHCLRSPRMLPLVLKTAALDVLGSQPKSDYGSSDRTMTRTYTLGDGSKLVLKGQQPAGGERTSFSFDTESMVWSVVGGAPTTPDEATLDQVVRLLGDLRVGEDHVADRALLIALLTNTPPSPEIKIDVQGDGDLWRLIAAQHPQVRPRLIAAFAKPSDNSGYTLPKFVIAGDTDMLVVVMEHIRVADDDYDVRRFVPYLNSLTPEVIEPHLGTLLASKGGGLTEVKALVKKVGRLPLAAALAAVAQGQTLDGKVMAYGEADLPTLTTTLSALEPSVILSSIATLRVVREAAPMVFDQVMAQQAARQDATGAAWLRMGLPFQAGMRSLYDQALNATQADVWLVGAAIALKESRLDATGFLAHVRTLPADSLKDAALVATRYLSGKLAGHEQELSAIITRAPASALAGWVPLLPAHDLIATALAERVRNPLIADQVGLPLAALLSADNAAWLPLVRTIAHAAGGRLDYLLPRE